MSPNYSVLISVYYKERPIYLKSALDSVLNQTLPPSEIILIKDGPLTVELEKVLSSYTTVQRNYPIGSVDLNRNHSSDVLV